MLTYEIYTVRTEHLLTFEVDINGRNTLKVNDITTTWITIGITFGMPYFYITQLFVKFNVKNRYAVTARWQPVYIQNNICTA